MKKYKVWMTTRASNRIEETCTYIDVKKRIQEEFLQ
jgi:hypothetical protein